MGRGSVGEGTLVPAARRIPGCAQPWSEGSVLLQDPREGVNREGTCPS